MTETVRNQIIDIIAEQTMIAPDEITPDATPEGLGIDSLGLVESIFALEEAFDISIPFNANEPGKSDFDITSLGSMIAAVERLIAGKSA